MMAMFCHVGQEGHVKLGFDPEYLGLKMLNYVITETKQYFADLTDYGSWRCCSWTDGSTVLHRFCAVANDFFAFMRRFQKQVDLHDNNQDTNMRAEQTEKEEEEEVPISFTEEEVKNKSNHTTLANVENNSDKFKVSRRQRPKRTLIFTNYE
ncbi:hypothetical protein HUJ05_005828, partial [Dendroctonus ponderosae]